MGAIDMQCAKCKGRGWEADYSKCGTCEGWGTLPLAIVTEPTETRTIDRRYLTQRQREALWALAERAATTVCVHDRPDVRGGTTLVHFGDYEYDTTRYVQAVLALQRMDPENQRHERELIG
jgi:hypothetical protein